MPAPSVDQLKRAIAIKQEIEKLELELVGVLGGAVPAPTKRKYTKRSESAPVEPKEKPAKGKRKMSPEGRARIIAAQQARWAKVKKKG